MRKYNAPENSIGHRLEIALEAKKFTAAKLAALIKTTRGAVSQQLNGGGMSAETLVKVARVLGVSPWWLALGEGKGPDSAANAEIREPDLSLSYIEQSLLMNFRALDAKSQRAFVTLLASLHSAAGHEQTPVLGSVEPVARSAVEVPRPDVPKRRSRAVAGNPMKATKGDVGSGDSLKRKTRVAVSRKVTK